MTFNMTFSEPRVVSQGDFQDELSIHLYKPYWLRPWTEHIIEDDGKSKFQGGRALDKHEKWDPESVWDETLYFVLKVKVPPQIASGPVSQALANYNDLLTTLLDGIFFGTIGLHFLFPLPTSMLWTISMQLQIFVHYKYFEMRFPGNYNLIEPSLEDFIHMFTIPPDFIYEEILRADEVIGKEKDRTRDYLFFGTDKYIAEHGTNILRTLSIMLVFFPLMLIVMMVLYCIDKSLERCPKCCQKPTKFLKKKVMFNALLRVMIESYMPIAFATGIAVLSIKAESNVDKLNVFVCILWGIYLLYMPYYFYRFLRNNRKTLPTPTIKE